MQGFGERPVGRDRPHRPAQPLPRRLRHLCRARRLLCRRGAAVRPLTDYDGAAAAGGCRSRAGRSTVASIEMGQSFELGAGWALEPQLQLIHQSRSTDEALIPGRGGAAGQRQRLDGARRPAAEGPSPRARALVEPYGRINLTGWPRRRHRGFAGLAASTDIASGASGSARRARGRFLAAPRASRSASTANWAAASRSAGGLRSRCLGAGRAPGPNVRCVRAQAAVRGGRRRAPPARSRARSARAAAAKAAVQRGPASPSSAPCDHNADRQVARLSPAAARSRAGPWRLASGCTAA